MDQIIDFAEIENFIDTPVKYYSSGMYVRLAFSVAAHLDPEILIVDEVLAVGDLRFQKKCLGKMEEVSRQEGRTILFVSHNLDAIRGLCDRAILLEQGRIVKDASVQEAISRYIETEEIKSESHYDYLGTYPQITSVSLNSAKLDSGKFELDIQFSSPYELRPVPGFVIYNIANVPVMGSNPRYHSEVDEITPQREGSIRATLANLELHTGYYKVSVWLGDPNNDYDHKSESIVFYYQNPKTYISIPDPLNIGSIDKSCQWQFADKRLSQDLNHQS
jgi:lipopolysaccharide transport system ATP-binding protein